MAVLGLILIKRRHQPLALGISSKQAHAFGRALYLKSWALDADNPLGSLPSASDKKKHSAKKERRRDELSPSASELLPLVLSPVG